MKSIKKALLLMLALSMFVTTLAGCKGSGQSSSDSQNPGSDNLQASSSDETYTYTIAQYLSAPLDADAPMVKKWEDEFGVKFVFDYIETSKMAELLPLRIASGDVPDVITGLGYTGFYDYAKQGIAGTWSEEFFREAAPHVAQQIDELGDAAWKACEIDGQMFTVPGVNAEYMYGAALIWNQDWLDKLGISGPPSKLEDVEKVLYQFRNDDPDGNGQKDTYGLSTDGLRMIFGAYGAPGVYGETTRYWMEDGNGGVVYPAVTEKAKEALTKMQQWYKDGVIDPEFITGENKGGYWALSHSFCNGRIGFTARGTNAHWKDPKLWEEGVSPFANSELFKTNFPDGTFSYGTPIEGPYGDKYTGVTAYAYWSCFSADLTGNEPKFAKLLSIAEKLNGYLDPKDYLTTRLGIEGVNWNYNENGIPVPTEEFASIEKQTAIGASTTFNFFNNVDTQSVIDPVYSKWEHEELYADKSRAAMWTDPVPLPLPSQGDYKDETDKILDEGAVAIITGQKDIGYFDEMVKAWKAAGGDILTQEANEIYQQFK